MPHSLIMIMVTLVVMIAVALMAISTHGTVQADRENLFRCMDQYRVCVADKQTSCAQEFGRCRGDYLSHGDAHTITSGYTK